MRSGRNVPTGWLCIKKEAQRAIKNTKHMMIMADILKTERAIITYLLKMCGASYFVILTLMNRPLWRSTVLGSRISTFFRPGASVSPCT